MLLEHAIIFIGVSVMSLHMYVFWTYLDLVKLLNAFNILLLKKYRLSFFEMVWRSRKWLSLLLLCC